MEIMQFVIGLYIGLLAGYYLRDILDRLTFIIRHTGIKTHGSNKKGH